MKKELRNKKKAFGLLVAAFLLLAGSGTAWGQPGPASTATVVWDSNNDYSGWNLGGTNNLILEIDGTVEVSAMVQVFSDNVNTSTGTTVTIRPKAGTSSCTIKRKAGYTGIMFNVTPIPPFAPGLLYIDPGVTIDGNGANVTATYPMVVIQPSSGLWCNGNAANPVVFQNAKGEVAIQNAFALGCTYTNFINNNSDSKNGGAVRNHSASGQATPAVATFTNCTFDSNVGLVGGAIFNTKNITCTDCVFTSNVANNNNELGGGAIISDDNETLVALTTLTRCRFQSNTAYNGGAILAWGDLACNNCQFIQNTAHNTRNEGPGGAIYYSGSNSSAQTCALNNCTFDSNSADFKGGALLVFKNKTDYCVCNITNSNFYNNEAHLAGAITAHSSGATINFYSGQVYNNRAIILASSLGSTGQGGGIHVDSGSTFNLEGGEIGIAGTNGGNTAQSKGGGVYTAGTFNYNGGNIYYNTADNGSGQGDGGGVYVAGGTFNLKSGRTINKNHAINGGGIYINGGTLNVNGTVGGSAADKNTATNGGGIYANGGSMKLNNDGVVSYNEATNGAGVYVNGGTDHFMYGGSHINNNATATNGGGVYVNGGMLQMQGGDIHNQSATYGGGVYVNTNGWFYQTGGTVGGTTAKKNVANQGAGIYSAGTTALSGGSVSYNETTNANGLGAGVYVADGTTTQNGLHVIERNAVANNGAGVYIDGGTFNMNADGGSTNHYVRNHNATNGAGVYLNSGTFNLSGGYVGQQNNANAATLGGGVYVNGGTFNMTGGNIVYNTASQDGAGVYLGAGTFNFENQGALSYNTATRNGGGVFVDNTATFNMKNSTLANNTAVDGGGVYVNAGGNFTMLGENLAHSCEVTTNTATGNGGGVYHKGTTTLTGLIIIQNNTKGTAANNMYLDQTDGATLKYSYIGEDGLLCGSYIGINNIPTSQEITRGTGAAAVANAQYAYRNEFFHYDGTGQDVYPSNNGTFAPGSQSLYLIPTVTHNMYTLAQTAQAGTDYVGSAGNISQVNTLAGLAFLAYDVNKNGNLYENKTVTLNADITIGSTDNWEPIGCRVECDPKPFKGTFNGQFHTISGLRSDFGYLDGGLFGYVEGGTIKNVLIASGTGTKASENLGALVGYLHGGTVVNCEARVASLTGENGITANVGGLVGLVDNGGKVHSSCAMPGTLTNGTYIGGLVGRVKTESFLQNSFAHTATTNGIAGLVDNGAVAQNCYVWGNGGGLGSGTFNYCYANAGTASGTNGVFGNTLLESGKYGYDQRDQQVTASNTYVVNGGLSNTGELGGLLATLNKWVGTSSEYSKWTRTMASNINGDYPVLMFADAKCLGSKDGIFIDYATDLNPMITAYNNATNGGEIYLYDVPSTVNVANGNNVKIFVNEDIGFLQNVSLQNVRTGITLDNSSSGFMSYDWHMFSPALTNAPMGLTYSSMVNSYTIYSNYSNYKANGIPESVYSSNAMNPPATAWNTTAGNIGYFPTNTPYGAPHDNSGCFDFYCYYEPYTHWVNFKREGKRSPEFFDHWRQNADENGNHQNIPYENESNMVRGKGYMVAIDKTSMLMTDGSLDNNPVLVDVTNTATLSGQEAALKGVNLIGNPYQAYLDFNQIGNNLNTYFVLDADAKGYIAYVNGGSRPTESGVINCDAPQYLHPHQGFFVRVPQGTRNITLNNTMILAGKGTSNFRSEANHYPMVNMAVEDERGRRDYTTVELDRPDEGGGEKIRGLHAGDASLWVSYGGQDWQVAFTKPGLREVPVRFEAYKDGTYTLSWETHNGYFSYMHLIDNLTGTDIDCLQADEYRFEATTHDYTSRFRLVFEFTGVEENDEPTEGPTSFAFMMGDELVINGEGMLEMFDLNGRCIFSETLHGTQSTVSLPQTASGVYILRLTANQQTRTQKMVINK